MIAQETTHTHQAAGEQPPIRPMAGGIDLNHAVTFLRDKLADGPVPGRDVYRAAESIGISKRTLERAKSQISVMTGRMGEKGKRGGGVWTWGLPVDLHRQSGDLNAAESKNDLHRQVGDLNAAESESDLHRQDRQLMKVGDVNQSPTYQTQSVISVGGLNEDIAVTTQTDAAVDRREAILGMSVDDAIAIWRSRGSPVFSSRQGEHLRDLEALLSDPDCQERHLKVMRAWLDKIFVPEPKFGRPSFSPHIYT